MIRVRPSVIEDVDKLAAQLRQEDVEEVLAAGSPSPRDALLMGFTLGVLCLTVEEEGHPVVMMGVVPSSYDHTVGHPWLLSSDFITRHPRIVLERSREWLNVFHMHFPTLTNMVDARNTKHVRWLRWLGFSIRATTCPGPDGHPFHSFTRTAHV